MTNDQNFQQYCERAFTNIELVVCASFAPYNQFNMGHGCLGGIRVEHHEQICHTIITPDGHNFAYTKNPAVAKMFDEND